MKNKLMKLWITAQILREEHGQDMVEYALVVGIIALGCILGMEGVATKVNAMWSALGTAIGDATAKI